MAREPLNTRVPSKGDIWEHVASEQKFLVLSVSEDVDPDVLCVLFDAETEKPGKLQVLIPVEKFKFLGNRGMVFVDKMKGKLPKPSSLPGNYSARLVNFGAK